MKIIFMGLLILIALSLILFLVREYMVNKWISCSDNVKRLIKHYGSEGINLRRCEYDNTFEVFFFHKGANYRQSISSYHAIKWMHETPKGGIRKKLVEKLK